MTVPVPENGIIGPVDLDAGTYQVSIAGPEIPRSTQECSGNISPTETKHCIIDILLGEATSEGGSLTRDTFTIEGDTGSQQNTLTSDRQTVTAETESASVFVSTPDSLPFKTCESAKANDNNVLRAASSAQYTVNGKSSLGKLGEILNNENTDEFTIKLMQDLNDNDGITLDFADPIFTGVMIVGQEPYKVRQVDFTIDKIDTKCNFVTLIQPVVPQNPEKDITPLGDIGQNKFNDKVTPPLPPKSNELLTGGQIVNRPRTDTLKTDYI